MSSVQRPPPQALSASRQGYLAPERDRTRTLNDLQEEDEDSEEINRLFPKCTPKSTPTNTPSSGKANKTLSDSLQQSEKKLKKKKKKKKNISSTGKKATSSKEPLVIVDKIIDLDDESGGVQNGGGGVSGSSDGLVYQKTGHSAAVVMSSNVFRHDDHKMLSPTSTYAPRPTSVESLTPLQQSTRIPLSTSQKTVVASCSSSSEAAAATTAAGEEKPSRPSTGAVSSETQLCDTKIEIAGELSLSYTYTVLCNKIIQHSE